MKIQNNPQNINSPSFQGYAFKKSLRGVLLHSFNVPHDSTAYKAYLEILKVKQDLAGNFSPVSVIKNDILVGEKGVDVNLLKTCDINPNEPFAYRYRLESNDGKEIKPVTDSGNKTWHSGGEYNLVTQLGSKLEKAGTMYHIVPDSFNVGKVFDDYSILRTNKSLLENAKLKSKTFSNEFGGTVAGIIDKLDVLKQQGYKRVIILPHAGGDDVSDHGYWAKNLFQLNKAFGKENDFSKFIRKLFESDMNLVTDGALVNEGLTGVHFQDVLVRGEASPYYHWFRAEGLKNGPLGLGVFSKNKEFITHRIMNSPYHYEVDSLGKIVRKPNKSYDPGQQTFLQIYDKRYKQMNDLKAGPAPIKINTHEDTVISYTYRIDPAVYADNVKRLNDYNKATGANLTPASYEGTRILTKASNYSLEEKFEGGFDTWDANNDVVKLNYGFSKPDLRRLENVSDAELVSELKKIEAKNLEVQDYAISAARYWTKKTREILTINLIRQLKDVSTADAAIEALNNLVAEGKLPKSVLDKVNRKVIENLYNGVYELPRKNQFTDKKELLLSEIMDLPLESIEFGDDIVSVLGYPHITNRPSKASELGKSRYRLFEEGNPHLTPEIAPSYEKTIKMYTSELLEFTNKVMNMVNDKLPDCKKLFDGDKVTEFGQYVLTTYTQQVAKAGLVNALTSSEVVISKKTGELIFPTSSMKNLTLNALGIGGKTPDIDAQDLVHKMRKGLRKVGQQQQSVIADAITNQISESSSRGFKLADVILDRTQAGLDWRIDATKDIADMDSIRNKTATFEEAFDDVVSFWKKFSSAVHKENPNSYLVAELTDIGDLHKVSGSIGKYSDGDAAERKLMQLTGINSRANYSYFFTDLTKVFTKSFEDGSAWSDQAYRGEKLKEVSDRYLTSAQLDSLVNSYNFIGNHDKPRALHCMALDMSLFHSSLTSVDDKVRAAKIIKNVMKVDDDPKAKESFLETAGIDFDIVSSKAVAMGELVRSSLGDVSFKIFDRAKNKKVYEAISAAISDLAQGKYLDETFSPDAFGVKSFESVIDMVLKQAEVKHGLDITRGERAKLLNKTFEVMLKPSMTKMEKLMSFLNALPGNPTLFAGDELGLTGYEEKAKNIYLQNRGLLNWDLDAPNRAFIKEYYEKITGLMEIRNNPRLRPLNTGTPYSLDLQYGRMKDTNAEVKLPAILRQDVDGEMVISVFNPTGVSLDPYEKVAQSASNLSIDGISLNNIPGKVKPGTIFYNPKNSDRFKVCTSDGNYYIKKLEGNNEVGMNLNEDTMTGSTFMLTTIPPVQNVSHLGSAAYNKQYNVVANPYAQKPLLSQGLKFKNSV